MPTTKTSKTTKGRSQDRAKVAGGQDYEVSYESKKTGKSSSAVKDAVKASGNDQRSDSSSKSTHAAGSRTTQGQRGKNTMEKTSTGNRRKDDTDNRSGSADEA